MDVQTNQNVAAHNYSPDFAPVKLAVLPDFNGNAIPELALCGVSATDGKVRVTVKDIALQQRLGVANFGIATTVRPVDVAVIPDINGNNVPEIARLAVRTSDNSVVADIKDARTGAVVGRVNF